MEYRGEVEKYVVVLLLFFVGCNWLFLCLFLVDLLTTSHLPPSLLPSHLNPTVYPKPADLTYVCMRECAYQCRL